MSTYIHFNITLEVPASKQEFEEQISAEADDLLATFEEIIAQKSFDIYDSTFDLVDM